MTVFSTNARFDRAFFVLLADGLAAAVAIALPWSTTAASICIVAWLVVLLPTLNVAAIRRETVTAAGGLPVLLWCLGAVGMLWASVDWSARLGGLDGFNRLLMIPLLFAQYRRSTHGYWVIWGFLVSSVLVLIASFVLVLIPGLNWRDHVVLGIPAHDDIYQSSAFLICAFALLGFACDEGRKRHWGKTFGLIAIGAAFLADFAFATFSRVVLLVAPVLAALLGWREQRWSGLLAACVLLGAMALAPGLPRQICARGSINRLMNWGIILPPMKGRRLANIRLSSRNRLRSALPRRSSVTALVRYRKNFVRLRPAKLAHRRRPRSIRTIRHLPSPFRSVLLVRSSCGRCGLRSYCCSAATA